MCSRTQQAGEAGQDTRELPPIVPLRNSPSRHNVRRAQTAETVWRSLGDRDHADLTWSAACHPGSAGHSQEHPGALPGERPDDTAADISTCPVYDHALSANELSHTVCHALAHPNQSLPDTNTPTPPSR